MITPEDFETMDCYQFLDTQVISYAFKGTHTITLRRSAISSIVASEFLLLQGNNPKKANYYIPSAFSHGHIPLFTTTNRISDHANRPFSKRRTDSVVMEFGRNHEPIIEYSNLALANVINNHHSAIFYTSIQHLEKDKQKTLRKRFLFLLDSELRCVPLNKDILDLSFLLLQDFMERHNIKQNFRNSWNDILILTTALAHSADLETRDNELSRFVAEQYAQSFKRANPFIHLSFGNVEVPLRRPSRESKGYINRGWKAEFNHY